MDVEKHLLDKIICLSFVPQNPLANIANGTSAAPEQRSKGISIAGANLRKKNFVGQFLQSRRRL
jgi:hypothetical protein